MNYPYYIVDVFSETPFGGNQLAVLPSAAGISAEGMQRIAREFNFAETTFVLPPSDSTSTCRVRIFTPKAEVAFAGHPTVGTACALVMGGHEGGGRSCDLVFEEGIGPIQIRVDKTADAIAGMFTLNGPVAHPNDRPDHAVLARTLSLDPADVLDAFYASVGLPFCFAHLSTPEAVDRAAIDKGVWATHFSKAWSPNMFFFSGTPMEGAELYARMSAPALGVEEDPATGSACAALAGMLASDDRFQSTRLTLKIVQGVSMGRRSEITAVANKVAGRLVSVSVGGSTAFVSKGDIAVPRGFLAERST